VGFVLGSVAVGQLSLLVLKCLNLTIIPLTLHTHTFLQTYVQEEEKRVKAGTFTQKCRFLRNSEGIEK
jgi:hypothetical protein